MALYQTEPISNSQLLSGAWIPSFLPAYHLWNRWYLESAYWAVRLQFCCCSHKLWISEPQFFTVFFKSTATAFYRYLLNPVLLSSFSPPCFLPVACIFWAVADNLTETKWITLKSKMLTGVDQMSHAFESLSVSKSFSITTCSAESFPKHSHLGLRWAVGSSICLNGWGWALPKWAEGHCWRWGMHCSGDSCTVTCSSLSWGQVSDCCDLEGIRSNLQGSNSPWLSAGIFRGFSSS